MLKEFLGRTPRIKKIAKFLFKGILKKQEERQVAAYNQWREHHEVNGTEIAKQKRKKFTYQPLFSIIAPTYNTPEVFFREMVQSVLDQTYANWELLLIDDASPQPKVRELINEYAKKDKRIRPIFLGTNHHIAGATNEAIKVASGEFISLFDHDDLLRPNALFEIATALNGNQNLDFIYTDEDKFEEGVYKNPFFKPDWNPDFLRSVNYITHFTTIRKKLLDRYGYEDEAFNGAQDWELYLRITRNIPVEHIHHIPKILYSWRIHDTSTSKSFAAKPYVVEAQRKAIEADLTARNCGNAYVKQDTLYPGQWQVIFKPTSTPKISIVVREKYADVLEPYIHKKTTYKKYDIVVIQENESYHNILTKIDSEYIVLFDCANMQNIDPDWLTMMLGDAQRSDIAFVEAKYSDKNGVNKNISNLLGPDISEFARSLSLNTVTKHLYTFTRYNIPEAEEGVVMIKTSKLQAVLGQEANTNIRKISSDARLHGYRNLYNPYVKVVK